MYTALEVLTSRASSPNDGDTHMNILNIQCKALKGSVLETGVMYMRWTSSGSGERIHLREEVMLTPDWGLGRQ